MSAELSEDIKVKKKVGGNVVDGDGFDITDFYGISGNIISIKNSIPTPSSIPSDYTFYYKFEDNLNDESGTYTATPSGSITYDTGKVDRGLSFPVRNQGYFDIGQIRSQEFSICLWWKYRGNITQRIICEDFTTSGNSSESGIYIGRYTTNPLVFQTANGTQDNFGRITINESSFVIGDWYHLTFTSNNTTKRNKAYVNGVEVGDVQRPSSIDYIAEYGRETPFRVNSIFNDTGEILDLDELAQYNRVLTPEEILDIYDTQKG